MSDASLGKRAMAPSSPISQFLHDAEVECGIIGRLGLFKGLSVFFDPCSRSRDWRFMLTRPSLGCIEAEKGDITQ